jgi:L,D-peptidoglycan transpeptidase YkuD (ErfK/YbiS/YcfS/YnhG family)
MISIIAPAIAKTCEKHGKNKADAVDIQSTIITVRPAPGQKSRALVQFGTIVVPAAIGRSGRTTRKREGDGATPIASMRLISGFRRGERPISVQTRLPIRRFARTCSGAISPAIPTITPRQGAVRPSHEEMQRKRRAL